MKKSVLVLMKCMVMTVMIVTCGSAQNGNDLAKDTYASHKKELLEKFLDNNERRQYDLVVNLENGKPADQGDSAWRTGLAAICMAIERDQENTARFLKALGNCWVEGRPVRHPEKAQEGYSRDQFIPQMAACYYAVKFGNEENKVLARELLGKFIQFLKDNDWKLSSDWAGIVLPPTQFVLRAVASKTDLPDDWVVFGGGNIFIGGIGVAIANLAIGGDNPRDYYAVHNLFWEILMLYECRNHTYLLKDATKELCERSRVHNMGPLLWIVGDLDQPREWLRSWPGDWVHVDYVWQRNLQQQKEEPNREKQYPRLDYMVLRKLFDLQIDH